MERILWNNIEKLKIRCKVASSRIELLTTYKESEPSFQKVKV